MENEQNPGVSKKRFLPSWRASTLDLFPPDQHDKLYINYCVEDVHQPAAFLAEYIASTPTHLISMSTEDRLLIPVITGELFKDGRVIYTNEPGRHEDLVEAEGKREDILAHFKIDKADKEIQIGIWTTDATEINDLVKFFLSGELDNNGKLTIEEMSDLFGQYNLAEERFKGTLGDYITKNL